MKNKSFHSLKILALIYMLITVALPMVVLLSNIGISSIESVFCGVLFLPMLENSLVTTTWATIISVLFSFLLAFLIHRSHIRFKGIFVVLFTIPMLVPTISHGSGLVLLFGSNGILTNLLGLDIPIYGRLGIIIGSVINAFPVSFLMFHDSFQYEDSTVYEAADILGISKVRQFLRITLPYLRPTVISALLAVFTMVFTDYGVALMVGGTEMTLPVYMYREVIGMTDFSSGAVIGLILLVPAFATFLLNYCKHNTSASGTIVKRYQAQNNKCRDFCILVFFLIVVILLCLPIFAFVCVGFVRQYPIDLHFSLNSVGKLLDGKILIYAVNSIAISLLTALFGVILSYFSAYVTTFSNPKSPIKNVLHLLSMLPSAFPGLVLGLSFVLVFHKTPLYSTLFILVIANIVHFFSSPYLLAKNALSKFSHNLDDAGQTLGIGKLQLIASVYAPSTIPTIVEMYSYFFVNAMITISAISFLYNFRTMPLSLLIPQLESQSFVEGTALVSLLILSINLLEKGLAFIIKRHYIKHPY